MKKLLLGLGTITAVTAPVVSVVACSSKDEEANGYLESGLTLDKMELIGHYNHTITFEDSTLLDDTDYVRNGWSISRSGITDLTSVETMIKNIREYQAGNIYRTGGEIKVNGSYTYRGSKPTGDAIIQVIYTNGKVVRKTLDSLVDYLMHINDISNKNLQQWESKW